MYVNATIAKLFLVKALRQFQTSIHNTIMYFVIFNFKECKLNQSISLGVFCRDSKEELRLKKLGNVVRF